MLPRSRRPYFGLAVWTPAIALLVAAASVLLWGAADAHGTANDDGSAGGGCPSAVVAGSTFASPLAAPLAVPDDDSDGVTDCFVVNDPRSISDLDVAVAINHTYVGDLVVTLTHEGAGPAITLIFVPSCAGNDIDVVLDDEAGAPVTGACSDDPPAIGGTFRPNAPLSSFDGQTISGTWRIQVSDLAAFDTGSLLAWSIEGSLVSPPPNGPPGDASCDGSVNAIDAALVLQLNAGLLQSVPCPAQADINDNGTIDAIDAAIILQVAAGLL